MRRNKREVLNRKSSAPKANMVNYVLHSNNNNNNTGGGEI